MKTIPLILMAAMLGPPALAHQGVDHTASTQPSTQAQSRIPRSNLKIPDADLLTQEGHSVRFYSDMVRGKTVVINFIYTNCAVTCPILGLNFVDLTERLGERAGKDVFLISVSVDPVADTPAKLKAWGEKIGVGKGWTLLTGDKREVDQVLKSLEVYVADKQDHTSFILMGNETRGEWKRLNGLAPAEVLETELRGWLGDHKRNTE